MKIWKAIRTAARETLMTSEKRKAEIRAWRRYYEARAKASNNYRRMHGLPMVMEEDQSRLTAAAEGRKNETI